MNTYPKTDSSFPSGPLSNKFKCCLSAKLLKYALTLPLSSQRGRNYVRFFFVVEKSVPHLFHFSFPISEIGDGKILWECLSIRYFNPKICFVIFSFHIFRGKYVSLNSNCIVTVTKFCHIWVVISSPQLPLNTKVFFHRFLAKPPSWKEYTTILK